MDHAQEMKRTGEAARNSLREEEEEKGEGKERRRDYGGKAVAKKT